MLRNVRVVSCGDVAGGGRGECGYLQHRALTLTRVERAHLFHRRYPVGKYLRWQVHNGAHAHYTVASYLAREKLASVDAMDPKQFARWIFPELVKHRRPLYQALADRYGYTITAKQAEQVHSEADFLALVEDAIGRAGT